MSFSEEQNEKNLAEENTSEEQQKAPESAQNKEEKDAQNEASTVNDEANPEGQISPEQPEAVDKAVPAEGESEEPDGKTKKEGAYTPKSTVSAKTGECAACGKNLQKKTWYYKNSFFFCNKKCFQRKVEDDIKKAEAEKAKS
ncbi:MAG: hypothetical protein ABH883_03525 [Candidatus Omnitrophota bacterium]